MQAFRVWVQGLAAAHLQQLLGQGDGDDTGRAAHAADAVGDDVGAHLELVYDAGAQAGRGAVQGAVGDQDVDLHGARGLGYYNPLYHSVHHCIASHGQGS